MKKLAIVGSHPGTRQLVPWDDLNFDIWTINEAATMKDSWVKRCTGIFQLHPRNIWDNPNNRNDPHHGEWLKANKEVTIFMMETFDDVPMCEVYPLKEIVDKYCGNFEVVSPRNRNEFMTCTVSYMAGLAAFKGYKEVHIYGVELSVDSEYRFQRPGASFWIGVLTQNAKVKFFGKMFDAPLYGYEEEGSVGKEYLMERIKLLRPQVQEEKDKIPALEQEFIRALQRFEDTGVEQDNVIKAWQDLTKQLNRFGTIDGSAQEIESRLKEIEKMIELDGSYRFSHHGFQRKIEALEKKRAEVAHQHAYMSGLIDFFFNGAVKERLQDSRRKKLLAEFKKGLGRYIQLCQEIGIYTGAMVENKFLSEEIVGTRETSDDAT